jgi:hypothetical protein
MDSRPLSYILIAIPALSLIIALTIAAFNIEAAIQLLFIHGAIGLTSSIALLHRSGCRWGRVPLPIQLDRCVCETEDIQKTLTGAAHMFRAVWHGGCGVAVLGGFGLMIFR